DGNSHTGIHHFSLPDTLARPTRVPVSRRAVGGYRLAATPVIADGRLFILDADMQIRAYALTNLATPLWQLAPLRTDPNEKPKQLIGGGMSYENGVLYVTLGTGIITALDVED